MVAGAGFEPRDLRVMSPTSYLAALPRDNASFKKLYNFIKSKRFCQLFFAVAAILFCKAAFKGKNIVEISRAVCYNLTMKVDLAPYKNLKICAAVSGGRDSMALLHYLLAHAAEYNITVCAVNFDHGMRGESSARDSAFVASYCRERGVPLIFFKWEDGATKTESSAHFWRFKQYARAVRPQTLPNGDRWEGADAIATAHHLNDNAETVLFNLARGSGLAGLAGIADEEYSATVPKPFKIIRPLIACPRAEIEQYVAQNGIPYVDDETNFADDYTRNKIRHNVLPELERAVPGAAGAIYRFSRIAAEDGEYFDKIIAERGLIKRSGRGFEIANCPEKSVFKRAVLKCLSEYGVRDYTFGHLETLYALQFSERGKKFEFCGYTAFNEGDKIAFCDGASLKIKEESRSFFEYFNCGGACVFCGQPLYIGSPGSGQKLNISCQKTLRFDPDKIPADAVIRFMRAGDKFTKFGGGTKNLGSYFTDIKIPARMRRQIPVVAVGSDILIVCGVEISQRVKIDNNAPSSAVCIAADYAKSCK